MAGSRCEALDKALQAARWRPEDLARAVNDRLRTLQLTSRQVHPKTPYKWLNGKRPYRPLPDIIAAVLSDQLQRPVKAADIWPELADSASVYKPADSGLLLPWGPEGAGQLIAITAEQDFLKTYDQLLPVSGSALLGPAHHWLNSEPGYIASVLSGDRITEAFMRRVERSVADFHHLDDDEGGGGIALEWANQEFRFVSKLINNGTYDDAIGRRLYTALAQLGQVAGWMAYDAGRHGLAQRYWFAGMHAARAADDRALAAMILSCMAFQATYAGRPQDAITLLETAEAGAARRATPTVLAMLRAWKARAYAELRDEAAFGRTLNAADDIYQYSNPADDPVWIDWMIQPSLTSEIGKAWLQLNRPDKARPILTEGINEAVPRDKVLYLAFTAQAHLLDDQLDAAATVACEATDIAATVNTPRGVGFLKQVREAMPAKSAAVRELDEKLTPLIHTKLPAA